MISWQLVFVTMSLLTVGLIGWVFWKVPDFPGQSADKRVTVAKAFLTPGIRPVLLVVLAWMLAHNTLYTYIAPFLAPAGLGGRVDLVLLVFGAAALSGIWRTGLLVDRWLRASVLTSLSVFALVSVALIVGGHLPIVVLLAVAVWGLTFGGAATLLQTASADDASDGVDISQAIVTTAWNSAIAAAAASLAAFSSQPWALALFPGSCWPPCSSPLAAAWQAKTRGFPSGPRASAQ